MTRDSRYEAAFHASPPPPWFSPSNRTGIKHPPTADHIMNEVDAVTNGVDDSARNGGRLETAPESIPRQVVIGHVDTVNIYLTPAVAVGRTRRVRHVL